MAEENNNTTIVEENPKEEKTFTQTDVNNLVARESKSAVEKLLKEVGITTEDGNHKKALSDFKAWQDSGSLSALEKEKDDAITKSNLLERKFTAVSKGIPSDKTDKYIKLAEAYTSDTVDFEKALDLALKDFPVIQKGVLGNGGNPPLTENNKNPLPSGTVIF